MPMTPIPAPRAFDRAAALYLSDFSDFPARFRWDAPARTWRRRTPNGWEVTFPEAVVSEAMATLDAALSATEVPEVFRCVFAPASDVAALEAVTTWEASRDEHARTEYEREAAAMFDGRRFTPRPNRAVVVGRQRERLRAAVSRRGVETAVRNASGLTAFAYEGGAAPVNVDPRAWLAELPRDPDARVLTSDLYGAYVDSLPTGSRPLHNRAFHALAHEVLGDCRRRIRGRDYYLRVSLPSYDAHDDGPTAALRLVPTA